MAARRLPPFELREGESILVNWPKGSTNIEVQLRQPGTGGRTFTARATYPVDLLRRPPHASTADWMRTELEDEFRTAMETRRTNRPTKKPRW